MFGWRLTQTPYNWVCDSARPGPFDLAQGKLGSALLIRVIRETVG